MRPPTRLDVLPGNEPGPVKPCHDRMPPVGAYPRTATSGDLPTEWRRSPRWEEVRLQPAYGSGCSQRSGVALRRTAASSVGGLT